MSWIGLIIISILISLYLRYKIKNILYQHKVDKFQNIIKECNLAIFKIRNTELHDFNKLLGIHKDLYAKGIRPKGLQKKKYFTEPVLDLTLDSVMIYSVDIWHMDSLSFWSNCDKFIGDNLLGLPQDTLHKTLVFNRYKDILIGSIGDYLYNTKLEYAEFRNKRTRF
jgi:hypothetical protein